MPLPNIDNGAGQDKFSDAYPKINAGLDAAGLSVVSSGDTSYGYLDDKVVVNTGITKTILNPGANETVELKVTPLEAWTSVTGAAPSVTSRSISYRKDFNGHVFIKGNYTYASSVSSPDGLLLTLPSGYRPAQTISFACTDADIGDKNVLAIKIETDGDVKWFSSDGTLFEDKTVYIDGINFFID